MDQMKIGKFIALKRKQLNLTQAELAQRLNVTNKSVSKWECGKCMPDYAVINILCAELGITTGELLSGEPAEDGAPKPITDTLALSLLERVQAVEKEKQVLCGILMLVTGIALLALSGTVGGSDLREFISGMLLGMSIGIMLLGVFWTVRSYAK